MNPNDLTHDDIRGILSLIERVPNITGKEAFGVAVIQQKLFSILPPQEVVPEVKEVPEEKLEEVIGKETE